MRFSELYAPTLKDSPSDADIVSYEYLVRGGFIRKVAAGIFTYLPLGNRVIQKITGIVREEMDKAGCLELLMPIAQPAEIWKQTGRWEDYGPEMMKITDRHKRDFTLGPTHEEMITVTIKNEMNSYKDLPKNLYQINTKYRDEIRPRFGLLRAREFIMKDAYSFHTDEESLDITYKRMYEAYEKILKRMGLKYMAVEADSGAIGGSNTHEFIILADSGESDLRYCPVCGYSATDEKAQYKISYNYPPEEYLSLQKASTPEVKTIQDVSTFLKILPSKIVKSLVYKGRQGFVMALIRGDFEVNLPKLKAGFGDQTLTLAQPQEILEEFKVPTGFIGPIGIDSSKVGIIADHSIKGLYNFVVGGMEQDTHFINCNLERDFRVNKWEDLKMVQESDPCPECSNPLSLKRGIEIGQVFKLGTKYSESLNAMFTDEEGKQKPFVMGCYGWGVSRTMAGVVEQLHDENGIIWPAALAPYTLVITVINMKDKIQSEYAENIYSFFQGKGVEVLLDDRNCTPGFKFKDADLIGFPIRITVGKKIIEEKVEIKTRLDKKSKEIILDKDFKSLYTEFEEALKNYAPGI